jgi:hypothetical protein
LGRIIKRGGTIVVRIRRPLLALGLVVLSCFLAAAVWASGGTCVKGVLETVCFDYKDTHCDNAGQEALCVGQQQGFHCGNYWDEVQAVGWVEVPYGFCGYEDAALDPFDCRWYYECRCEDGESGVYCDTTYTPTGHLVKYNVTWC